MNEEIQQKIDKIQGSLGEGGLDVKWKGSDHFHNSY